MGGPSPEGDTGPELPYRCQSGKSSTKPLGAGFGSMWGSSTKVAETLLLLSLPSLDVYPTEREPALCGSLTLFLNVRSGGREL